MWGSFHISGQCPQIPPGFDDRYHWYTILEKCYFFYPNPSVLDRNKNYTESRELCQSLGGKMYEPKDLKTNDGINENIANSFWMSGSNYWIGINDMSMENVWKYLKCLVYLFLYLNYSYFSTPIGMIVITQM